MFVVMMMMILVMVMMVVMMMAMVPHLVVCVVLKRTFVVFKSSIKVRGTVEHSNGRRLCSVFAAHPALKAGIL